MISTVMVLLTTLIRAVLDSPISLAYSSSPPPVILAWFLAMMELVTSRCRTELP